MANLGYAFVPGAVTANTPTALPADAPVFQRLSSVVVLTGAAGGTASTTAPAQATVIQSGTPTSGEIVLGVGTDGGQTWEYGSATTDGTVLLFQGDAPGTLVATS